MTAKDNLLTATRIVAGFLAGAFFAVVITYGFWRDATITQHALNLFTWSIRAAALHMFIAMTLTAAAGVLQVIRAANVIFTDGSRQAFLRRDDKHFEEFVQLDFGLSALPEPRQSDLRWLDDELKEIFENGGSAS